jgi:hypothetical protein
MIIARFVLAFAGRVLLFLAVVAAGLWYMNRPIGWSGDDIIASGDTQIEGKAGLVVVALIQPETFEPAFFVNFLDKLREQVIPFPINAIVGLDRGIVLVDPTQPFMTEPFEPVRLADLTGREQDVDGVPWVEKYRRGELRWQAPSPNVPYDLGVYVYPKRKQGMGQAAAITSVKARYLYYAQLPEEKLPHHAQTRNMVLGAIEQVRQEHDLVAAELADAFDPYQKEQAVRRVLDAGADTLVLASAQPIYSSFEELEGSFRSIYKIVESWRAENGMKPIKLVIPPYMASLDSFDDLMLEHIAAQVPDAAKSNASVMGILSLHGLPVLQARRDSWTQRSKDVAARLLPKLERLLKDKGYTKVEVHLASEAFADDLEDPSDEILSVQELYRKAVGQGTSLAFAVPLDFLAENTDNLYAHSTVMFEGLPGYVPYQGPPADVDWDKPFVRKFRKQQTDIWYLGTPGGSTVPAQSAVLAQAIGAVLK